jgi:hypothetical protein
VDHDADYRVPYELSNDYWLYRQHLEAAAESPEGDPAPPVFVIGDSVIWGEYVTREGTLSHFLNAQPARPLGRRFINAGVNGLFPLALEGLVRDHAGAVKNGHVLLHANLLWMTSPEADLSIEKEHKFNHEALVPQFGVRIPCYRADAEKRIGYLMDRKISLFAWTRHLEDVYFDRLNVPGWTLEEGNEWRAPWTAVTMKVPGEPGGDAERGEESARHRSWVERGLRPQNFAWVELDKSLQWQAFQRLVDLVRSRDNQLLVVIGPFNEHMIAPGAREGFEKITAGMEAWFAANDVSFVEPSALPGHLYGDSSHPLTEGYRQLARELEQSEAFRDWMAPE